MGLLRLLRYGTRHHVYFSRDRWLPQLNPISYSSHSRAGKRTFDFHEPLWVYRLRQRLFCHAGRQRCGRRDDDFAVYRRYAQPDTWNYGPDGCRTCSYCGSIHFDDLMDICRMVPEDERYAVEGTDKAYKVYVRQPGVRNASEGAIKFYKHHSPDQPTAEEQELFSRAIRISHERFEAKWNNRERANTPQS